MSGSLNPSRGVPVFHKGDNESKATIGMPLSPSAEALLVEEVGAQSAVPNGRPVDANSKIIAETAPQRKGLCLWNSGTDSVYVAFSRIAKTDAFTFIIAGGEGVMLTFPWKGPISAICASGESTTLMVTDCA